MAVVTLPRTDPKDVLLCGELVLSPVRGVAVHSVADGNGTAPLMTTQP